MGHIIRNVFVMNCDLQFGIRKKKHNEQLTNAHLNNQMKHLWKSSGERRTDFNLCDKIKL